MTDKEIIKALECCKKLNYNSWKENKKICGEECPYKANCYDEEKNINMILDVLDLINRQQAKLEALTEDTLCLRDTLEENERLRAEIERLSNSAKQWEETAKDLLLSKEKAKSEAEQKLKEMRGRNEKNT
jgi:hypothetical protein